MITIKELSAEFVELMDGKWFVNGAQSIVQDFGPTVVAVLAVVVVGHHDGIVPVMVDVGVVMDERELAQFPCSMDHPVVVFVDDAWFEM